MQFSPRRVTRFRGRRCVNGGPHVAPPPQRRARLTRRQAKEIIHTWDQQITRLRRRVDDLAAQNAKLADTLAVAVRICDEAIAAEREPAPIFLRIENVCRVLWFRALSLQSQLHLPWRSLLFSVPRLSWPSRRKTERTVGWPFEPGLEGPTSLGSTAAAEHSEMSSHCTSRDYEEPKS